MSIQSTSVPSPCLVLAALVFMAAAPIDAAPPTATKHWCGTGPERLVVSHARHVAFERHIDRQRQAGLLPTKSAPNVSQVGDLVLIEDDGTILIPARVFDFQGKSMQFLRRPRGLSVVRSPLDFKQLIGDKIELGDDDSVRIDFPPGFTFPIGEQVYTSAWLNSDGNLTFGSPEPQSSRSLVEFLFGPPRVAPFYVDLDPSVATGENGVYVGFPTGRVRITWLGVPEFGDNNLNTFQVTLFTTGRVNFAYGDEVQTLAPIVGVSPFGDGALRLMNYDEELPEPPRPSAIAEEFIDEEMLDDFAVGPVFFEHYQDRYTYLVNWLDFNFALSGGSAFAFEITVNNNTQGTGEALFNFANQMGSDGTLESYIQMGAVGKYRDDPDQVFLGTDSTMSVLAHEVGHRWLAKPRFRLPGGSSRLDLLQSDRAHWSFFLDADGSVMEGNDWVDEGNGSFRSTDRATTHYSPLDQYLMGLIPPSAVEDFFLIENPNTGDPDDNPAIGLIRQGERLDISIDDVIAASGRRVPTSAAAPTRFRMAFILIGEAGQPISQESIDRLETIRARWVEFFQEATDSRAEALTELLPKN